MLGNLLTHKSVVDLWFSSSELNILVEYRRSVKGVDTLKRKDVDMFCQYCLFKVVATSFEQAFKTCHKLDGNIRLVPRLFRQA